MGQLATAVDRQLEGLTLRMRCMAEAIAFYAGKLALHLEIDKSPALALLRAGRPNGGTIGLLPVQDEDSLQAGRLRSVLHPGVHHR